MIVKEGVGGTHQKGRHGYELGKRKTALGSRVNGDVLTLRQES